MPVTRYCECLGAWQLAVQAIERERYDEFPFSLFVAVGLLVSGCFSFSSTTRKAACPHLCSAAQRTVILVESLVAAPAKVMVPNGRCIGRYTFLTNDYSA
jgi:hypothetical protein